MMTQARNRLYGIPPGSLKMVLGGWLAAEVICLVIVVKSLGIGGAVLLGVISSLVGVFALRRLGLGAARQLRAVASGGAPPEGALLDGMLTAVGALLLILPGFASDLAGLALLAPSTRQLVAARLGGTPARAGRRPGPAGVIDLAPGEWTVVERTGPR